MKTKKEKLYQGNIPISYKDYNQHYILESYNGSYEAPPYKNFIFKDTFKFTRFERGRSSAVGIFTNEAKNLSSSMFLSNVSDVILLGGCNLTNLSGYFCMCKKGSNYGLKYLGNTLPEDCGLDFVENHIDYISKLVEGKQMKKYNHLIDTILIYENEEEATLYKFLQDNLEELEAELYFIGFPNKIYIKSREWYNSLELKRRGRKYIDMDSITIQEKYGQFKEINTKDIGLSK